MTSPGSWRFSAPVRQDLQRHIGEKGVLGLQPIRKFLFGRFGLDYCQVATLLRKMCLRGELKRLGGFRYYVPHKRKKGRDSDA